MTLLCKDECQFYLIVPVQKGRVDFVRGAFLSIDSQTSVFFPLGLRTVVNEGILSKIRLSLFWSSYGHLKDTSFYLDSHTHLTPSISNFLTHGLSSLVVCLLRSLDIFYGKLNTSTYDWLFTYVSPTGSNSLVDDHNFHCHMVVSLIFLGVKFPLNYLMCFVWTDGSLE